VKNSPSRTLSETSSTARTPAKLRATPSMLIAVRGFSVHIYPVMAGLVPAIHALLADAARKTWMPATSAGMTTNNYRVRRTMSWIFFMVSARLAIQPSSS
jgi:hypothetical protein